MQIDDKAIQFLKQAKLQGISQQDAFSYLSNKGYEISTQQPEYSAAAGAAQRALGGASGGFADEIQGLVQGAGYGIGAALTGRESVSQAAKRGYEEAAQQARYEAERFQKERPSTALGLDIVGALASPLAKVGSRILSGGTGIGSLAARGASMGAIQGGIAGAGTAEGGLGERISGAKTGVIVGGVLGGAAAPLAAGGAKILESVKRMPEATVGQALGESAMGKAIRGTEKLLSQSALVGAPLRASKEKAISKLTEVVNKLAPRALDTTTEVGKIVKTGLSSKVENIASKQNQLYQKNVYNKLPLGKNSPATSQNIQNLIEETRAPGAKKWLTSFVNNIIPEQGANINDIDVAKRAFGASHLESAQAGMDSNKVYAALKKDLYDSVKAVVPEKSKEAILGNLKRADKLTSAFKGSAEDLINEYSQMSDEKIVNSILNLAKAKTGDSAKLNKVFKLLPVETRDTVKQSIIKNLEPKTYEGMSENAKNAILGNKKATIENSLQRVKELNLASLNPSGTAANVADIQAMRDILGSSALVYGGGAALGTAAGSERLPPWLRAALGVGSTLALSKGLASPKFAGKSAYYGGKGLQKLAPYISGQIGENT